MSSAKAGEARLGPAALMVARNRLRTGKPVVNVTIQQIRAYVAVSRLGSFTRAADALPRAQSAITLQIKQLDQGLGLRLFDRSSRRIEFTAAGAELLPRFDENAGERLFSSPQEAEQAGWRAPRG